MPRRSSTGRRPFDRAATATTAIAALPEATARFNAAGVIPTYLVDYPVIATEPSAAIVAALAGRGDCDVGAQLHPWVTPPHAEAVTAANSFPGNLPAALEAAKIAALTRAITGRVGAPPVAYRAGRYGIGANTAAALVAYGYRLDVSVRAGFDYRGRGGPDFRRHPITPLVGRRRSARAAGSRRRGSGRCAGARRRGRRSARCWRGCGWRAWSR